MAMEEESAVTEFETFLNNHIPAWHAALDKITTTTSTRRVDVEAERDLPTTITTTTNKDSSTARPGKRKRSAASSSTTTSHASHPRKSRTRRLHAIIYYDSNAQRSLDTLVTQFHSARRIISRALAAPAVPVTRDANASSNSSSSSSSSSEELDASTVLARIRASRVRDGGGGGSSDAQHADLQRCDEALAQAISTCQDAAFALLRDGHGEAEFAALQGVFVELQRVSERVATTAAPAMTATRTRGSTPAGA